MTTILKNIQKSFKGGSVDDFEGVPRFGQSLEEVPRFGSMQGGGIHLGAKFRGKWYVINILKCHIKGT